VTKTGRFKIKLSINLNTSCVRPPERSRYGIPKETGFSQSPKEDDESLSWNNTSTLSHRLRTLTMIDLLYGTITLGPKGSAQSTSLLETNLP
jgi:hypothetical protein